MIFDRIENIDQYGINLNFILDDLNQNLFNKGKFDIDGEKCFGIGLEYDTKISDDGLWEAHRKYLDIHVVLEGVERIEICDINKSDSVKEYEDDYELFKAVAQHSLVLSPGYFLILFPHEVHKTGVMVDTTTFVRKKVFKNLL
ncbi:YhcH/YjgK/YiaL family protein [Sphingobacterium faecium]|uniref:YhcH/YjgK/YiaL family protein n=1 Tax=Sphingobacterium faecium TaxID=34087 RepID=UPI003208BD24